MVSFSDFIDPRDKTLKKLKIVQALLAFILILTFFVSLVLYLVLPRYLAIITLAIFSILAVYASFRVFRLAKGYLRGELKEGFISDGKYKMMRYSLGFIIIGLFIVPRLMRAFSSPLSLLLILVPSQIIIWVWFIFSFFIDDDVSKRLNFK